MQTSGIFFLEIPTSDILYGVPLGQWTVEDDAPGRLSDFGCVQSNPKMC